MALRRLSRLLAGGGLLAAFVLTSSACVSAGGRVYLRVGPPTPIVEARLVTPGPGYVWLPGFYRWDEYAYVWVPGRWDRPPRAHRAWVPGHWARTRHGWYFVEGHWR